MNFKKAALCSATILSVCAFSTTTAFAQDVPADEATADEGEAILVTGSRIRQPNLESANPISVVTGEQLFNSGTVSVGDQLNQLPQLRSTYSQANSTRNLGNRGLNLLDLRGLGTARTLVLVNGRRHVGSDVLLNGVSPDINTISTDMIERVDVVTGGASAVYGSDAIAGVVNFVLKDNYEGLQLRGQAGVSQYGDYGSQYASLLYGKNFADGRGNITFNAEYTHQAPAYASGRPGLRNQQNFIVTDTDPASAVNGADSVIDRTFYRDIRSATISLGGLVAAFPNPTAAPCGTAGGSAFTCTYLFQPDGTLTPQSGTRIGIGPNGNYNGGDGMSGREGNLITLTPDLKKLALNLNGHFEVSEAFVPFFEAKYVRSKAFGSQSGPFFSQGTTLGDPGGRERVRLDNPYLTAQARGVLSQQFLATTVNANTGAAFTDTLNPDGSVLRTAAQNFALQQAAINAGSFRFSLRRNWTDFGSRDEDFTRETYRIVAGIKGNFWDDFSYELSGNYGEHRETNIIRGNVNVQRYLLALDTTRDGSGNIVCRSKLNPAGTISYLTGNPLSAGDDPRLAGDIAACTPLNPFGQGSVTQAARDYILVDSVAKGKLTQVDILGFISGTTSKFFNLPGGPIGFSIGGEYRRETNQYDLDDLTQEGYAFYNAIPSFNAPSFEVKEAYGEIQLPIFRDAPFAHELTIRGSGRISDYKGSIGTVYTYGGEATWAPVADIKFRGTYSRSVRAPTLSDLYSTPGQNFAPAFVDPCSARNIATGSANRAANCAAAGRPAGYDFVYIQSLETVAGGNPNLKPEKSDSYTAGVIIQPRWVPGLSLSVDYYDITVNGVIASVTPQNIANLCYDSPSLNNQFCALFQRAGAGGGPNGEIPFQILEGSLLESSLNYAKLKARGIDTTLNYQHEFDFGAISAQVLWNHQLQRDDFTSPTDPTFKDRVLGELNWPKDRVNFDVQGKFGKVTIGYGMRWIAGMYVNTYEDYNPLNGLPPQNADYAPIKKYPSVFYHDIKATVEINDMFDLYAGVDNVTNKMPPYGLTGVGAGSGIYDNRGRYMFAGFKAKIM